MLNLQVADRMKEYEEGIFQLLDEKKAEVEKTGKKVYNLSVGTPDFPPSERIMKAVEEAARKPENYKYSLKEIPELKQALIERYRTRYQVELKEAEFTAVYGSQEGIAHIALAYCNPGDVVLVPDPGYPIFSIGPSLAMADVRTYPLLKENDYLPDLKGMDPELLKKTKMMIVSYPLNPICRIAPDSFYDELIPWAKENNIIIVHDNAYSDIVYDGHVGKSILSHEGAKDICVEFYSLSKSFNYTGARMGFLVGNEFLVQTFKKLRSQIDYGAFLPVQYGAVAALTGSDEENILLTLYANHVSHESTKVVTKINRLTFNDVIDRLDLGSVIYPRYITAEAIIAYVRAKSASRGSNIETLYHMFNQRVEAIEFKIDKDSKVTNKPLSELNIKKNVLISFINRHGKIIIPSGQDCIKPGDTVMIVTKIVGMVDIGEILD